MWEKTTSLDQRDQIAVYSSLPVSNFAEIGQEMQTLSYTEEKLTKQEAQLMLTNPRNAFRGQSRSPNIVPLHMVGILSSWAIVTLSLRRAVFLIFDFKNAVTLKTGLGVRQGHWKCHRSIEHI